jgi:hypothetical protein
MRAAAASRFLHGTQNFWPAAPSQDCSVAAAWIQNHPTRLDALYPDNACNIFDSRTYP